MHDFYDRLTSKYMLQLNYWRGPIDAWPLLQNIGPPAPRIDAPDANCYTLWRRRRESVITESRATSWRNDETEQTLVLLAVRLRATTETPCIADCGCRPGRHELQTASCSSPPCWPQALESRSARRGEVLVVERAAQREPDETRRNTIWPDRDRE